MVVAIASPVAEAIPGMATRMPSAPENKLRTTDFPPMEAINTKAMSTRVKNSNGPNFAEASAIGSDKVTRKTQEMSPPINDAPIPRPRARPGSPPLAMGKPSRVVMIEAGVPGMRSKVAVIMPPLTEPTYMPTNRVMAWVGSMAKVAGG